MNEIEVWNRFCSLTNTLASDNLRGMHNQCVGTKGGNAATGSFFGTKETPSGGCHVWCLRDAQAIAMNDLRFCQGRIEMFAGPFACVVAPQQQRPVVGLQEFGHRWCFAKRGFATAANDRG